MRLRADADAPAMIDPVARVQALRMARRMKLEEREAIVTAPLPASEALVRYRSQPPRVVIDVDNLRSPQGPLRSVLTSRLPIPGPLDVIETACRLIDLDGFDKRIEAEIVTAEREHPAGLPSAARPAAVAKVDTELLAIEVEEEAVIAAAEVAGGPFIDRRADVRATVVLGKELGAPAAREKHRRIAERPHRLRLINGDLADRRLAAHGEVQRCRQVLEAARRQVGLRPTETDPQRLATFAKMIPPSLETDLRAAEVEFARLDEEATKASAAWQSAAACLAVLNEAIGMRRTIVAA